MEEVKDIIESMPIEMKVGQLFLLAYPGKDPNRLAPLVDKYGICGCYISQDNAESFEEAAVTSKKLQAMATSHTGNKLPMILAVDQEGAWGFLVPHSQTGPGNLTLGANTDKTIARDMYRVFGEEMLSVGYNTLLAPCSDVNTDPSSPIIGTRSFGENPAKVAELVALAVEGAKKTGILVTLKHFPGHGATSGDTHREIPWVDKSLAKLLETDLLPFIAGIKAGADIVMTNHILYPQIDGQNPTTLSKVILQDILRQQLQFEGVVLSDSMNMGAIRHFYDPAESAVSALKAGVDVVMLSEEHYDHSGDYLSKQMSSMQRVYEAIRTGEISQEEVDAKLYRIISMKRRMLEQSSSTHVLLTMPEKLAISERAASGGVCLIRDDFRLWPVKMTANEQMTGPGIICMNATPRHAYSVITNARGIGPNQTEPAYDALRNVFEKEGHCNIEFLELDEAKKLKSSSLEDARLILLVTEDYPLPGEDMEKKEQQEFVRHTLDLYREKCVIIGLRSPYELLHYQGKLTYLCSYSSRTCSAEAVARVLIDGGVPKGVNHITLQ